MIKRIMRLEQLRDYEKDEREKNNPTTPGTGAKPEPKADEPKAEEAKPE